MAQLWGPGGGHFLASYFGSPKVARRSKGIRRSSITRKKKGLQKKTRPSNVKKSIYIIAHLQSLQRFYLLSKNKPEGVLRRTLQLRSVIRLGFPSPRQTTVNNQRNNQIPYYFFSLSLSHFPPIPFPSHEHSSDDPGKEKKEQKKRKENTPSLHH